jgi:hypothetical protein
MNIIDMTTFSYRAVLEKYIVTINDDRYDQNIIITDKTTLETLDVISLTEGYYYQSYVFAYSHNSFIVTTFVPGLSFKYINVYLCTITDDGITVNEVKPNSNRNWQFTDARTDDGIIAATNTSPISRKPLYIVIKFDSDFKEVVIGKKCNYNQLKYVLYTKHGPLYVSNLIDKLSLRLGESTMELDYADMHYLPEVQLIGDNHISTCRYNTFEYKFYSIKNGCLDVSNEEVIKIPAYTRINDVLHYESSTDMVYSTDVNAILRVSTIPHTFGLLSFRGVSKRLQFITARDGKIYVHAEEGNVIIV